ncbi:glycosyltransferase [Oryzihumus sp.]
MTGLLAQVALWGGVAILVWGLPRLLYVPLALAFELGQARRRRRGTPAVLARRPLVTVIVPAYNEERVLEHCVSSVLASGYDHLEVVLVDDGSSDGTLALMRRLARTDRRVTTVTQPNAGKGAALNRGIAVSRGEFLLCVDADGVFGPDTVTEMLRGLDDPRVGAVCGDDRPVNLNRPLTHVLAVLSHVGTGLARRALSILRCLPIVSGNLGAFPRHVVEEIGGFREDTVGEDLELTWRVHRAGYRVAFRPTALVYAEVPSTVRALWRQRVRWARGLLQTLRIHRGMLGRRRYGVFGFYLVLNAWTMVGIPVLQLVVLVCVPFAFAAGHTPFSLTVPSVMGWLGLWVSLALAVFSILLNRAGRDLRFLWTAVLWPVYSTLMGMVMAAAIFAELRGTTARWDKLERSGVVSRRGSRVHAGLTRPAAGP